MRDLYRVYDHCHNLSHYSPQSISPCLSTLDASTSHRYTLLGDTLHCLESQGGRPWRVALSTSPALLSSGEDLSGGGAWVCCFYISSQDAVFLAHSGGAMVTVTCSGGAPAVEYLGSMEGGVLAGALSGDESMLALVTGACNLLVLSPASWDVLSEEPLAPFSPTLPVHATWRSDGSALAIACSEALPVVAAPAPAPAPAAPAAPHHRRVLRVVPVAPGGQVQPIPSHKVGRHEDGTPIIGLHTTSAIGWSPDGTLLAVGHTKALGSAVRTQVSFFEPNGLTHGELILTRQGGEVPSPTSPALTTVYDLAWSAGGEALLCVQGWGGGGASAGGGRVAQVWLRDNYHWALKWEGLYSSDNNAVASACAGGGGLLACAWDPERPLVLHSVVSVNEPWQGSGTSASSSSSDGGGTVVAVRQEFSWRYTVSGGGYHSGSKGEGGSGSGSGSGSGGGILARVGEDGCVRFTPLQLSQVPPPYAYTTLAFQPLQQQQPSSSPSPQPPPRLATRPQPIEVAFQGGGGRPSTQSNPEGGYEGVWCSILASSGHIFLLSLLFLTPKASHRTYPPGQGPPITSCPLAVIGSGSKEDAGEATVLEAAGINLGGVPVEVLGMAVEQGQGQGQHPSPPHFFFTRPGSTLRSLTLLSVFAEKKGEEGEGQLFHTAHLAAVASVLCSASEGLVPGPFIVALTLRFSAGVCSITRAVAARAPHPTATPNLLVQVTPMTVTDSVQQHSTFSSSSSSSSLFFSLSNGLVGSLPITLSGGLDCTPLVDQQQQQAWASAKFPEALSTLIPLQVSSSVLTHVREEAVGRGEDLSALPPLPTTVCVGVGAGSGRLYVGSPFIQAASQSDSSSSSSSVVISLSPSVNSAVYCPIFGLLSHVSVGPTPLLTYTAAPDLVRAAARLPPSPHASSLVFLAAQAARPPPPDAPNGSSSSEYAGVAPWVPSHLARVVERGCTLIASLPGNHGGGAGTSSSSSSSGGGGGNSSPCYILQALPRGNIETVSPRFLSLTAIRRHLLCSSPPAWREALELARTTRIDLNFLHDISPRGFAHPPWLRAGVVGVAAAAAGSGGGKGGGGKGSKCGGDRWDLFLTALTSQDCTQDSGSGGSGGGEEWGQGQAPESGVVDEDGGERVTTTTTASNKVPSAAPPSTAPPQQHLDAAAAAAAGGWAGEAVVAKYPTPSWAPTPLTPPTTPQEDALDAAAWLPRALEAPLLLLSLNKQQQQQQHTGGMGGKVNAVCAHLRSALLHTMCLQTASPSPLVALADAPAAAAAAATAAASDAVPSQAWRHPLVLPVITSYARQTPADLEAIIGVIQCVAAASAAPSASASSSSSAPTPTLAPPFKPVTVEEVIAHATLVCDGDVELLYTAALGAYDLKVARALAERCASMDPREYVPFLARLWGSGGGMGGAGPASAAPTPQPLLFSSSGGGGGGGGGGSDPPPLLPLPLLRQRIAIDVHLGRWGRALRACVSLAARSSSVEEGFRTLASARQASRTPLPSLPGAGAGAGAGGGGVGVIDTLRSVDYALGTPLCAAFSMAYSVAGLTEVLEGCLLSSAGAAGAGQPDAPHPPPPWWAFAMATFKVCKGWWLAAGGGSMAATITTGGASGSATNPSKPPPSGFPGRLLVDTAPPSLLPAILTNFEGAMRECSSGGGGGGGDAPSTHSLNAALSCFLLATPPALVDALALCGSFPGVSLAYGPPSVAGGGGGGGGSSSGGVCVWGSFSPPLFLHQAITLATLPALKTTLIKLLLPSSSTTPSASSSSSSSSRLPVHTFICDASRALTRGGSTSVPLPPHLRAAGAMVLAASVPPPATTTPSQQQQQVQQVQVQLPGVEEAVEMLCECGAWGAAGVSSGVGGRGDLMETEVLGGCEEACDRVARELDEVRGELSEAIRALVECRALRGGQEGEELLGGPLLWEACLAGGEEGGGRFPGGGGEGGDGGDGDGDDDDDVRSLWSNATSLAPTHISSASSFSASSSSSSALHRLAAPAKSSGVFSHFAIHSVKQRLEDTRRTLVLGVEEGGGGGGTSTVVEARERSRTAAAVRVLERREEKGGGGGGGRKGKNGGGGGGGGSGSGGVSSGGWEGRRPGKFKGGRAPRPGSKSEEEALEAALKRVLPREGSPFLALCRGAVAGAVALGLVGPRERLVRAWEGVVGVGQAATIPTPRRDVWGVVREAREARGLMDPLPPHLAAELLKAHPPPRAGEEDPVEELKRWREAPPRLV